MKHQHVLIAVYSFTILTLLLIGYSVKVAPIFTSVLVTSICTIFLFMASESYFVHLAAETENRFWTFIALVVAVALFFAQDSPIVILVENQLPQYFSWSCVTVIVFSVHNYDRSLRRAALTRVPSFRKAATSESSSAEIGEIMNFLHGIDNPWISSSITSIVMLPRVLWL